MITILDYGLGNLSSIENMIKKAGGTAKISDKHEDILQATKLIIPGVGHFARGMENLEKGNFISLIKKKSLEDKIPVLGICLGMQLLTDHSEEGDANGLGLISAQTKKFQFSDQKLKVPHMGWSEIDLKPHPLFEGTVEPRYYFVHSYYVQCDDRKDSIATCTYGHPFDCAIGRDNIMGVQFHPEKSHRFGMHLFRNFIHNF